MDFSKEARERVRHTCPWPALEAAIAAYDARPRPEGWQVYRDEERPE